MSRFQVATEITPAPPPRRRRPRYLRRLAPDCSQAVRRTVQIAFLALNVCIGIQFYLFIRQFENGEQVLKYSRPPGVEGYLPIAGLMNLKAFLVTGEVPAIHPAAMVLIATFLVMSILFRKAFCGWLCPVGTLSEALWKHGRATFGRTFDPPRWLDIPLRSLKYILLGLFLYVVIVSPVVYIRAFLSSPYGLIADVQMLNFFRYLSVVSAVTLGILLIGSIFVKNLWCRFLCPYGALMGLGALFSPLRIRRDPKRCIDCAKCAKVCPSRLPVDTKLQIRSAECLGCLECVAVCPAEGALDMSLAGKRPFGRVRTEPLWIAAGIAILFLGAVGLAKLTGHWDSPIANEIYGELIPRAREFGHP
ncbi:MAG: 4Fe-4S binding protein [Bryobacteraceae bacterium]